MDNGGDILQLCRLCLVKDDVNIPIFEEQGDIRQIFLKISSCLPVKVSREDKLPKKICDGCSYKLDMLYEFWNTTANAEKQLLSWLGEAGMNAKMADGTISAVAQQIKPVETFVKQEAIDPSDIHTEDNDDDKSYMFQQKFAVEEAGPSATVTSNEEEPPPKRQRRTAAVKAQIAMDPESDDDDDSGEPITKVEDESEESDGDDHEPPFVDVPSTSADDQPGPSGVGKDGVEAPSRHEEEASVAEASLELRELRECAVLLNDVSLNKHIKFFEEGTALVTERSKKYTCYVCMSKFFTASDLAKHKSVHEEENDADLTSKDDDKDSDYSGNESEESESEDDCNPTSVIPIEGVPCVFHCVTCKIVFITLNELRTHASVSEKCIFSCKICLKNFNNSDMFLSHIIHHKTNSLTLNFFKCQMCSRCFDNYFQLRKHEVVSHNLKPWTVRDKLPPIPDKESGPKEILESQIKDEPPDQDLSEAADNTTVIACELCFDLCNSDEEFIAHMEFHKQLAEDTDIINNDLDSCTPNSEVGSTKQINDSSEAPRVKFVLKSAPTIKPKTRTKPLLILPKPSNNSETNTVLNTSANKNLVTINKTQTSTIYVKDILTLKDSSNTAEKFQRSTNNEGSGTNSAGKSNVTIKQFDPIIAAAKRVVLKKEFFASSEKWVLTEKDTSAIKNILEHKVKKPRKNKNAINTSSVPSKVTNAITSTTVVQSSGAVTNDANKNNTRAQKVFKRVVMKPGVQPLGKTTNTTENRAPKVVTQNNPILPKVNPVKPLPNVLPKPIPIPPTPIAPKVGTIEPKQNIVPKVRVPPATNPYISVALDKQNTGSIPNNWSNTQNQNSNLIYVINPVNNNVRVPPDPQVTYINDTSNYTYFLMPPNPTERNVPNVNFAPQTSVIPNHFPVSDANKVVYTLPTLDQSLNMVSQRGGSQMSSAVTMPMLSSDNNLYFITNQPSSSVQGNMQSTSMIVTQPNSSVGGRFFPQS